MDFVRSYFATNEPVEHFFPHILTGFLYTHSKPVKKWGKKCLTGQRFICTEVTSYKIHTLAWKKLIRIHEMHTYDLFFIKIPQSNQRLLDKSY